MDAWDPRQGARRASASSGLESELDVRALVLDWYAHWLRDEPLGEEPPVRIWIADEWRAAEGLAAAGHRASRRCTCAPTAA